MLKVVTEFHDAPMQTTPFVFELAFVAAEFDDLAKREVS